MGRQTSKTRWCVFLCRRPMRARIRFVDEILLIERPPAQAQAPPPLEPPHTHPAHTHTHPTHPPSPSPPSHTYLKKRVVDTTRGVVTLRGHQGLGRAVPVAGADGGEGGLHVLCRKERRAVGGWSVGGDGGRG